MNILQKIDGYKTYALLAVSVVFGIIEFMIKGDYSMSSFIVLSQQGWVVAVIAALRHGIAKAGNLGNVNSAVAPLIIFALLFLGGTAFADVSIQSALQSINIPTTIDELQTKAVNAGYFYNWKDSKVQPTFTYDIGGAKTFSWGTFDYLDIGYASPDVLVAGPSLTLNIAIIEKKWGLDKYVKSVSIQNVINSMSIGLTPMLGLEQIGGRNRFTGGPGGFIKVKW